VTEALFTFVALDPNGRPRLCRRSRPDLQEEAPLGEHPAVAPCWAMHGEVAGSRAIKGNGRQPYRRQAAAPSEGEDMAQAPTTPKLPDPGEQLAALQRIAARSQRVAEL
jgi:acyl-CoA hydrolase